jgi:hypothetical protein
MMDQLHSESFFGRALRNLSTIIPYQDRTIVLSKTQILTHCADRLYHIDLNSHDIEKNFRAIDGEYQHCEVVCMPIPKLGFRNRLCFPQKLKRGIVMVLPEKKGRQACRSNLGWGLPKFAASSKAENIETPTLHDATLYYIRK